MRSKIYKKGVRPQPPPPIKIKLQKFF